MMQRAKILLVLMLLLSSVSFAVDEECYICDLMAGKPQAQILLSGNIAEKEITAHLFYENFSAEVPRTAIDDSLLFVYVISGEGDTKILKMFTDEEGSATFDFSSYAIIAQEDQVVYEFRVIYCPFCHPEDEGYPCGFDECVSFSGMEVSPAISGAENPVEVVPLAEGATLLPEDGWKREYYLPASASFTYTPPPPIVPEVPAFCFPVLLIFALLSGAMYFSGKNPFAGFNLGTPRMGRHIRYTPGGRGMSISGRYVAQSIAGAVSEGKEIAASKKAKKEMSKEERKIADQEAKTARKQAATEGLLNFVTLGAYGTVTGATGRVAAGPKGGFTTASGKGLKTAIKDAKKVAKGAKAKGRTAHVQVAQRGRIGGKGGYFRTMGKEMVKAGMMILGGSFLGSIGMSAVTERIISAIDRDQVALQAGYLASRDLLYEEGKVGDTSIHVNEGAGVTIDEDTGTVKISGIEGLENVEITLDKTELESGNRTGEITVEKSGKAITVSLADNSISGLSISSGEGAKRVVTDYNVESSGIITSVTVTTGEGKNAVSATGVMNHETKEIQILSVVDNSTGNVMIYDGTNKSEIEQSVSKEAMAALEEGLRHQGTAVGDVTRAVGGLDDSAITSINNSINQNLTIDTQYFIGKGAEKQEVILSQQAGAEPGEYSKAVEVHADGSKTEIKLDNGQITGITHISQDGTRTVTDYMESAEGKILNVGQKYDAVKQVDDIHAAEQAVLNSYQVAQQHLQADALQELMGGDSKIVGLQEASETYVKTYNEGMERLDLQPGGELFLRTGDVTPEEVKTAVEAKIGKPPGKGATADERTEYAKKFETTATEVAAEMYKGTAEGYFEQSANDLLMKKIDAETKPGQERRQPTDAEKAAVQVITTMGTSIADMKPEDAYAAAEARIKSNVTLTEKEKEDAMATAMALIPNAKLMAKTYNDGAADAASAYYDFMLVHTGAMESMKGVVAGVDEKNRQEVLGQIEDGVSRVNMAGESEAAVSNIAYATVNATADNPAKTNITVGDRQKELVEAMNGGAYKPPEVGAPPKPPKPPEELYESLQEHSKKLGEELYYNLEAQEYNAKVDEYNKAVKAQDPDAPGMPKVAVAPPEPDFKVLGNAIEKYEANPDSLTEKEWQELTRYSLDPQGYMEQAGKAQERTQEMLSAIEEGKVLAPPPAAGPEEDLLFDMGKKEFDDYRKKHNKENPDAGIPAPPKPPKMPKEISGSKDIIEKAIKKEKHSKYQKELENYRKEVNEYITKKETYEDRQKNYRNDILYGTVDESGKHNYNASDSLIASSVFIGAMKKNEKIPDKIYKDARTAAENGNVAKYEDASIAVGEYLAKEKAKRRKKMAEDLSEFEM